ncbi:MAG: AmmeMemoRadiSam system protein B [Patescibacteria group bacterium]
MSNIKKGSLVVVILLFIGLAGVLVVIRSESSERQSQRLTAQRVPIAYDQTRLNMSFDRANVVKQESSVRGIILPHHLVASDMIAEALLTVDMRNVKRIIVIGPNHGELGDHTALSTNIDWEIGEVVLGHDKELYDQLLHEGYIANDQLVVMNEHAVTVPLSYIQDVASHVRVLPIILSENQSVERLIELGERLALDEETLIIASVDFAHYLSLEESNENDLVTLDLIESMDVEGIYELDSDYIDSSSSIIVFLEAMKALGTTDGRILNHSNSAIIQGVNHQSTTSYYTILYK